MNSTLDLHLYGWVGDSPEFIELVAHCDADLAGDRADSKSTSGVLICLVGPRAYMPITGVSKKQTSVSKSTPEAEIVALDHGVSKEGMALATLWQHAIGKGKETQPFIINVLEDNESACRIVITGNNPNMRYMSRTQRIDISWLNERFNDGIFRFVHARLTIKVQTFLPRPASTRSYGTEICIPLVCSCRDTCRNIWPNPPNPRLGGYAWNQVQNPVSIGSWRGYSPSTRES